MCKFDIFVKNIIKKSNNKKKVMNKYKKNFKNRPYFQFLEMQHIFNNINNNFNKVGIPKRNKYFVNYFLNFKPKLKKSYILYTRYNNNFLIAVFGSKKLAVKIKKKINIYITTSLFLQIKKNIVFMKNNKPISFLDFYIKQVTIKKKENSIKVSISGYKKKYNNKVSSMHFKTNKNFEIISIKAIYESMAYLINPVKTIKKQNISF
jgi:hypothetical protein